MDALMIDMEEDLAALFDDDDFKDDASDGFSEEEVWEVNEDWLMAHTTPPLVLAMLPPSVYEVGGPSTMAAEGPCFPHLALGLLVPPFVIEDLSTRLGVEAGVTIREIGPRFYVVEGQAAGQRDETVTGLAQQVQALQIEVQQRDMQMQQLQTTVSEMSSRESSLMQYILGLDKRIAALE
ncbi:hypothetical protein Tco_1535134, partial [Tanacetum coccineum]